MRHRNALAKLHRKASHRKALLRNLLTSLVLYERVKTTKTKAKALQGEFDRLVTKLKKKEDFNQIRLLKEVFYTDAPGKKLREVLLDRFKDRPSGYTRILKLGVRKGDDAPIVLIELV